MFLAEVMPLLLLTQAHRGIPQKPIASYAFHWLNLISYSGIYVGFIYFL